MAGKAAETKEEVVSDDENPVSSGDDQGQNTGAGEEIESPEKCASPTMAKSKRKAQPSG